MSGSRRFCRATLVVVLLTVSLAAGERGVRVLGARLFSPTRGAQWIWAGPADSLGAPLAFYAVRDFELNRLVPQAELLALADEEYLLYLNGKRLGSNRYYPGAGLDIYEVESRLQAGINRLVVELRSRRGAGGFLTALLDPAVDRPLLVSDRSWRIYRRHHEGLVRGWLPSEGDEEALVWQYPPTGRWRSPDKGREMPPFSQLAGSAPAVLAPSRKQVGKDELGAGFLVPKTDAGDPHSPVLFDWGKEVTGFLVLEHSATGGAASRLYFGTELPDPQRQPDAYLIPLPDQDRWLDVRPRRFRFLLAVGFTEIRAASVFLTAPEAIDQYGPFPQHFDGVFGIELPGR